MAMTTPSTHPPALHAHDGLHRAAIVARGLVAVALGCVALAFRTYSALLVGVFIVFALVDGLVRLIVALRSTSRDRAWLIHALEGVCGIAFAVLAWNIAKSLITLTWTIAEWAFGIGLLTIVFGGVTFGRLRDAWLWILGGVLLIALGVALLWFTLGGLLAPGVALGVFGILYGVLSVAIGLRAHPHDASTAVTAR